MEEKAIYSVRAIAALKGVSIEEMAKEAGIKFNHLKSVSSGRATMTADDLIKLADYSGLNPFSIKTRA